jgi:hypothetical protein
VSKLTEQQEAFLNALFGEAAGNFRAAMDMAGYSKHEYSARLIRQMKNEIIERAEYMLAANAPKAVLSMSGILDDPSALGNRDRLAAAKEILDRAGLVKTEKIEHKTTGASIILLPPLEDIDESSEDQPSED